MKSDQERKDIPPPTEERKVQDERQEQLRRHSKYGAVFMLSGLITSSTVCLYYALMAPGDSTFLETFSSDMFFYVAGAIGVSLMFAGTTISLSLRIWTNLSSGQKRKSISKVPGSKLLSIAETFASQATLDGTIKPLIADLRKEYFDALNKGAKWRARYFRLHYSIKFAQAMGLSKAYAVLKKLFDLLKIFMSIVR